MSQRSAATGDLLRYVYVREGSTPAVIPGDVVRAITATCSGRESVDRALDFAGVVVVRLGRDAGTNTLRHWTTHDPTLLRDVDPVLVQVLAYTPELITGPLGA